MKKIFTTMVLSLFISTSANALSDCQANESNCWDCGKTDADLCTARLNGTELKITGTGEMRDYTLESGGGPYGWGHTNTPWGYKYTSVSVEGVKNIGEFAFVYSSIITADISDTVEAIGEASFGSCYSLQNVTIPDSVISIETDSFSWAPYSSSSLQSFFIPESVVSVDPLALQSSTIGTIYCAEATNCQLTNLYGAVKTYTTDTNGIYKVGENYYASPDDMMAKSSCGANDSGDGPSELCITKAAAYQKQKAESMAGGALCKTASGCLKLINMANKKEVCSNIAACKAYGNEHGILFNGKNMIQNADGSYTLYDDDDNIIGFKGKRIYTVEEASKVVKPQGNTFKIRYR